MSQVHEPEHFDVVICGGGLAGLTLARQLRLNLPEASVVLVDRLSRPLPEGAFKVGESLVETGSHYLTEKLDLAEYFADTHVRKLGFRFFFGDSSGPVEKRPEFGLSLFPPVNSYQIDRGVLENDLREFNLADGVVIHEGCFVEDVRLAKNGGRHEVDYRNRATGQVDTVRGRWIVDAMGRSRYLQKKLNLGKPHGRKCSSAWFRFDRRVDIGDLVPEEAVSWHARVPDGNRFYSTNHLMGDGYWVWLIPLSSGYTSVGIVTLDEKCPIDQINTYSRALRWLQQNEPVLAAHIGDTEPLDFRVMREYSYAATRIFSMDRWACVGEAAVFPDPFYALASDLIGFSNSVITEMVRLDLQDALTPEYVEKQNNFVLSLNHWLTFNIQVAYPYFGNGVMMACKVIWDTAGGWSYLGPQMFNSLYLDEEAANTFRKASAKYFFLTKGMQQLFVDWAAKGPGNLTFDFIDFLSLPFLRDMQIRNLQSGKSMDEILADQALNIQWLEELAQAIFLLAVEDVAPEHLHRFPEPPWLNAWSVNLDPDTWEMGVLRPTTEPRDLEWIRSPLRDAFRRKQVVA